ncbi:MAG: membrane dipeptidase [Rubrobacteraceae bacterium]|nr:membrane dipeptidase [Rubrobacteraceae bacterium]MBA3617104.1 membrane dipeptidase [Rubrobacteraceae bacterium]MDQ3251148.1 dipeptidase [Actinomycetota bacterium]MDQ3437168.1 dipeptidase [Actinomycetota bacterium]
MEPDFPLVFDGHNDTLLNLHLPDRGEGRSFFERSDLGHIDLPRAREGSFGGGFFACYVPNPAVDGWNEESTLTVRDGGYEVSDAPPLDPNYARRFADELAASLFRLESEGGLRIVRTAGELQSCLDSGELAAILHFEGAENLGPDPGALEEYCRVGLRSLGLVWSRPNTYAHGVPFRFPSSPDTGPGLTGAGKELVRECNRLGVLVDLSHLNERGFWDVAGLSEAPLVATHSNAHALCPASRNLTDRQLDAIRDSDGMVGVNFAVAFLREDGGESDNTPLETVVRHVDYLVERVGIDRVGFGSDFDGAKVPEGIGDVSGLPELLAALRASGYDEPALEKLAHGNWIRALRATWRG